MEEVNEPIKPIPTTINSDAIILPEFVEGDKSPYPTVVAVTNDHHNASENVICSKCIIPKEDITINTQDNIKTYLKPFVFRNSFALDNILADKEPILNSLVNFKNLVNLSILNALKAELYGMIAIRSNRFSFTNFFLLLEERNLIM